MKFHTKRKDFLDERRDKHYNPNRQGHGALVDKATMYRMRWLVEFEGWKARKIESEFRLDYRYVIINVMGYRTMASVIPVRHVLPDDYIE